MRSGTRWRPLQQLIDTHKRSGKVHINIMIPDKCGGFRDAHGLLQQLLVAAESVRGQNGDCAASLQGNKIEREGSSPVHRDLHSVERGFFGGL